MKKYRCLVDLRYPTDPAIIRKLKAGEDIPMHRRGARIAARGEIVTDLPAVSIPGLLEARWIEEVKDGAEE